MLDFLGDLKRTHMCGALRASDAGSSVATHGMGQPPPRPRQPHLPRPARPHRHHPGRHRPPRPARPCTPRPRPSAPSSSSPSSDTSSCATPPPSTRTSPPAKSKSSPTSCASSTTASRCPSRPADNDIANEEVRLKYRYLDLRRPEMHANIALRHRVDARHPRIPQLGRASTRSKRPS